MIVVDLGLLLLLGCAISYVLIWFLLGGPRSWREAKQAKRQAAMKEVEYALRDHDAARLKRIVAFEADNFNDRELEYIKERESDFALEEDTKKRGF